MTFETETVLDRRRLRRRLSLVARACRGCRARSPSASSSSQVDRIGLTERRQIARVTIEGLITEDRDQLKLLKQLAENQAGRRRDPVHQQPRRHHHRRRGAVRGASASSPRPSRWSRQIGTVATSAAYIAGLATDHIVARGNTITGSVGVIFQWAEVSQLLDKLGVKMNEIKSGPLKANPSPFQPLDEAGTVGRRADGRRIQALVRRPGRHAPQHRHAAACRAWSRAACSRAARRSPTS